MANKYYGHPMFYELLDKMKEIHSNKNHDYSGEGDPFRNFRMSEEMGIPSWKGCLIEWVISIRDCVVLPRSKNTK